MPTPGADYLGGAKYPSAIVAEHVQNGAAGIFLHTFGDSSATIRRLCPIASEIVVHVAPFDSRHSYPLSKYLSGVLRDAKRLERIAQHCNAIIMLSPFCEHNHSSATMRPVFRRLQKIAPHTVMLNSIERGGIVAGVTTELHIRSNGKLPAVPRGEFTVSYDGYPNFMTSPSVLRKYRRARHIRFWFPQMNGKAYATESTPIAKRKHWPSRSLLRRGWARLINHLRGL